MKLREGGEPPVPDALLFPTDWETSRARAGCPDVLPAVAGVSAPAVPSLQMTTALDVQTVLLRYFEQLSAGEHNEAAVTAQAVPLGARSFISPLRLLASAEMSYNKLQFVGRDFLDLEAVDSAYQEVEGEMTEIESAIASVMTLKPPGAAGDGGPAADGSPASVDSTCARFACK